MSASRGACENAASPQNVRFGGSGAKPGICISHHCPGTTLRALLSATLLYCLLRLLDGMERSLKLLVLPDLQPPFENVPPLTFPPWSGCGSGSKRIRDAEPGLRGFRVNGCSHPMSPRRGRDPGVQGGDTSYPTMPDGANRSLSSLRMNPRGTTGQVSLLSVAALLCSPAM